MQAELGDLVIDMVTNLKGIISCESRSLSGCRQVCIQPPVGSDGKAPDGLWVDESRCQIKKKRAVPVSPRFAAGDGGEWHGPRPPTA